jgi:hypothetical protein
LAFSYIDMHKLKIYRLVKIIFVTFFLAACGGTDTHDGNSDVQVSAEHAQASGAGLPQIQMQDAAGAIITGFNYDAQAAASSVTAQLARATSAQSTQVPQLAQALGFIIKYKADVTSQSTSAASAEALNKPSASRMSAMQVAGSKAGVQLSYGIRLALGAHTFKSGIGLGCCHEASRPKH